MRNASGNPALSLLTIPGTGLMAKVKQYIPTTDAKMAGLRAAEPNVPRLTALTAPAAQNLVTKQFSECDLSYFLWESRRHALGREQCLP